MKKAAQKRKADKTANINASVYEKEFQASFDCVGVNSCQFTLCHVMPPDGSEECIFYVYGSCGHLAAQRAALEGLRDRITKELKKYASEDCQR